MLPRGEALERLADVAVPAERWQQRVTKLRGDAHLVARHLTRHDLPAIHERMDDRTLGSLIDGLAPRSRTALFGALNPALGSVIGRAWVELAADPYTREWQRRAFRDPSTPETSWQARTDWLRTVVRVCLRYEQEPAWLAAWAPHLGDHAVSALGRLLAVAIDHGDTEVADILLASLRGDHEIGRMGRHVTTGLLSAGWSPGWEAVEGLLLAAQRQEGLRQVVLEAVHLAHPEAFRRMVLLVGEHGLSRFSAVVRAVGVWLGEAFDVADRTLVDDLLARLAALLDAADPAVPATDDPGTTYLALWAMAHRDVRVALAAAADVTRDTAASHAEHRLAAARLLAMLDLPEAVTALAGLLEDPDDRVVAVALAGVTRSPHPVDVYDALRTLVRRYPEQRSLSVGIWKPARLRLSAADAADALPRQLAGRSPAVLDDLLAQMSARGRHGYAWCLSEDPPRHRDRLVALLADASSGVRDVALTALAELRTEPGQAPALEELLRRTSADLRRGVIGLLLRQDDEAALASVRRLGDGVRAQREAGEEVLRELQAAGRLPDATPAPAPRAQDALLASPDPLVDHAGRTPVSQPVPPEGGVPDWSAGVRTALVSLDAWLAEHRGVEVTVSTRRGPEVHLVENLRHLPTPQRDEPWPAQQDRFPLRDLVEPWWQRTAHQLTDGGLEALLAGPAVSVLGDPHRGVADEQGDGDTTAAPRWAADLAAGTPATGLPLSHWPTAALDFLEWFAVRELRPSWIDALLDLSEAALAAVPADVVADTPTVAMVLDRRSPARDWRGWQCVRAWFVRAEALEGTRPEVWSAAQRARLWHMACFLDEPRGRHVPSYDARDQVKQHRYGAAEPPVEVPRRPVRISPPMPLAVRAHAEGIATEADLVDLVVGERFGIDRMPLGGYAYTLLGELTRRRLPEWAATHSWLRGFVGRLRDRIVAIEQERGELPTPVTPLAMQLRSVDGVDALVGLLHSLGERDLVRGYIWQGLSRPDVFSHLIRVSQPAPTDTAEGFASAVTAAGIPENRLRELAVYAPQWSPFVEATLHWDGLTDAVHWLRAHTKDNGWHVDEDVRDEWAAAVHERTPLTAAALLDGAADVDWFERVRARLGDERFDLLLQAARYASSSIGHTRAQLFARALRGRVSVDEVATRMHDKRHQDSVRALGLVPLAAGAGDRKADLLRRYELLMAWRRESRRFGQQRRASEGLAADIALANLARTAGYRDPVRLTWSMEAEAVRDLAAGPQTVTVDDVTLSLSIGRAGTPELAVRRGRRVLKAVPRRVGKHPDVVALKARADELRVQQRRMRTSFESSSVRGDELEAHELADLWAHPVARPLLERLLLVTRTGVVGWPRDAGRRLEAPDGERRSAGRAPLRIAHPVDLLAGGSWHEWQRACFVERVRQPFKQVFRELYVPTAAELAEETRSSRYAGQQVNPRQASALLGARGWVVDREAGALRTFHDHGLTARLSVLGAWLTPGEVEGMTVEHVWFAAVGEWTPVALADVPPRLFSETMRDLDLAVSVAHAGGVDPEASASTVQMRAALVAETAELLGLDNVELTDHHVLVRGQIGSYSVHLGSGTVFQRPGNALCIIPVHAQHRGRVFLPFVDDDPRTAEVVSKVVLLARDDQIRDPTILEQLRA